MPAALGALEVLGASEANAGALNSLLRRRRVGAWRRAAEGRAAVAGG